MGITFLSFRVEGQISMYLKSYGHRMPSIAKKQLTKRSKRLVHGHGNSPIARVISFVTTSSGGYRYQSFDA
ncbi:hypothetical protein TNCV_51941 [Trichonephila clavipes]|nr:hypothetical protein TNCV_51941 [Trichonephila clavipes]